jgi:hypothetical protein
MRKHPSGDWWHPDEVARLRKLKKRGYSSDTIARMMGRTKDMICGKWRRVRDAVDESSCEKDDPLAVRRYRPHV